MIENIRLTGFKRFEDQSFAFAPLTILAGVNGTGKTSLIHALLLAREASLAVGPSPVVMLNGPFDLELGTAGDVRNWGAEDSTRVEIRDEAGDTHKWVFDTSASEALHLGVLEIPAPPPAAFQRVARAFTYLCAERLGPRSVLGSAGLPDDSLELGIRGEYCAQIIAVLGNRPIGYLERRHPDHKEDESLLLKYEAERWLSQIARPTELDAVTFPGTTVTALRYRVPGGAKVTAPNMGFGVTYCLPIVLAGLIARRDGLLIVENPEAHLHPAGQSRMGVFLAHLAAHGVQVVVETHSDHVFNGIRRAIGEHHLLEADRAVAHFFDTEEGDVPVIQSLHFTSSGGVSAWPRGFLDQYQIDVAALTRVRRQR